MKRNAFSVGSLANMGGGVPSSASGASLSRGLTSTRDRPKPRFHSDSIDAAYLAQAGWYDEWKSIQTAIVSLFEGSHLTGEQMNELCTKTREIAESEMGPFVYDYYKNNILPKAMAVLLAGFDQSEDECLIQSLEKAWVQFYQTISPVLQIVMKPVRHPSDKSTCRRTAGLAFRDYVVLGCGLERIMSGQSYRAGPLIKQMLLVLMLVKEAGAATENYLRLEALAACAVSPMLGPRGLYVNSRLVVPADREPRTQNEQQQQQHSRPSSLYGSVKGSRSSLYRRHHSGSGGEHQLQKVDEVGLLASHHPHRELNTHEQKSHTLSSSSSLSVS